MRLTKIVLIGEQKYIFVLRIPPTEEIEFLVAKCPKYRNVLRIFHSIKSQFTVKKSLGSLPKIYIQNGLLAETLQAITLSQAKPLGFAAGQPERAFPCP